jgi:hypothetical protein
MQALSKWVSRLAVGTAVLAAAALAPSTTFAASSFHVACDWYEGDNTPTPTFDPPLRYGYIDLEAGYWVFVLDPHLPVGTKFRLEGQYPNSRYMSIQLYAGQKATLQALTDYQIQPDAGSQSAFTGPTTVDTTIPPYGKYTLYIVFGPAPATPAPNTLYVDETQFTGSQLAVFQYRIYNPFSPSTVVNMGGSDPQTVLLPQVYEETDSGDVPLSKLATPKACSAFLNYRNNERQSVSLWVDKKYADPLRPDPIPARKTVAPKFQIYQVTDKTELANADNRYIFAIFSQRTADLVLMRGKAPTYATEDGVTKPQLRHWSMCENSALWPLSFETYDCVEDYKAKIDDNGYFNIVMSVPSKKPDNADHAHGFDWLDFGTTSYGAPILRHQIASPDFTQSAFNVPWGADPAPIMGDYLPQATYCAQSIFDQYTNAGATPEEVFQHCQQAK